MIICDKCGAENDDKRFICCDCGRELVKPKTDNSFIPKREDPPKTGESKGYQSDRQIHYEQKQNMEFACTNCGTINKENSAFCRRCGHSLPRKDNDIKDYAFCKYCGHQNNGNSVFCQKCGRNIISSPDFNSSAPKKKDKNKTLIILVITGIVLFFVIMIFMSVFSVSKLIIEKDGYKLKREFKHEFQIEHKDIHRI